MENIQTWQSQTLGCTFTLLAERSKLNCCVWRIDMTDQTGFMNQQAFPCNPHATLLAPCAVQTNSTRLGTTCTHSHTQLNLPSQLLHPAAKLSATNIHTHQGFIYIKYTYDHKHSVLGEFCITSWIVMTEYDSLNN